MKKFVFLMSLLFALPAMGEEPIGFGLATGDGVLHFKKLNKDRSEGIDTAIGFGDYLYVHSSYLWNRPDFRTYDDFDLAYYTGAGIRALNKNGEDNLRLGARFPLGLSMNFKSMPLEVFTELSLTADVIPKLRTYLDLGLGFHYYVDIID